MNWIVNCLLCSMHARQSKNQRKLFYHYNIKRMCLLVEYCFSMQSQEEIVLFSSVSIQINKFTFLWRRENEKQYYRLNTFTMAPTIVNIIYIGTVIVAVLAITNLYHPFVKNMLCFSERQIEFWTRFHSLQIPFMLHGNL